MNKEIDKGGGDAIGGSSSGESEKGLQDFSPPPPFLMKVFNIVNDPETNHLISWGPLGTSFIIWDHIKFTAELLPKHYKHNNLSSFVYQLNNYGFRKIGVQYQWEYENPYFQAGKEHLLSNIKRRDQILKKASRRGTNKNVEIRLEMMMNELNELKVEIQNLKKQKETDKKNEQKQSQKLIMLLTKACEDIFCDPKMMGETHDEVVSKKRKIYEVLEKFGESNNNNNPNYEVQDQTIPLSENRSVSSQHNSSSPVQLNQNAAYTPEPVLAINMNTDYTFWKKILLGDDEVFENEVGTKIAVKLEGLIEKPDNQETHQEYRKQEE